MEHEEQEVEKTEEELELEAQREAEEIFEDGLEEKPAEGDASSDDQEAEEQEASEANEEVSGAAEESSSDSQDGSSDSDSTDDDIIDYKAENAKLQKMVEDNKSHASKVSAENAKLKKQLGEQDSAINVSELPEDVQAIIEDNPALLQTVQVLADHQMKKALGDFKPEEVSSLKGQVEQLQFNNRLIGGFFKGDTYVQGHPDALQLMAAPEFTNWMKEEKINPDDVGSVESAINLIGKYKGHRIKSAVADDDKSKKETADAVNSALSGGPELGTSTVSKGSPTESPEDVFAKHA